MENPIIAAARGQRPKRYPVWFLRQAGRYLPEYQKIRDSIDFVSLCKSPAKAAEVSMQPLRRFDIDAAIIFSDILIPCTAMGQVLTFDQGHGPRLSNTVRTPANLKSLRKPSAKEDLAFVGEALSLVRRNLTKDKALIGFAGAPYTVATYMVEGGGTRDFTEVKRLAYNHPATFAGLLDLLVEVTVDYVDMQVTAGADLVMLFDTWANSLTTDDYVQLVLPRVRALAKRLKSLHPLTPIIYYPGQGGDILGSLSDLAVDVIACDWRLSLDAAIKALQKNRLSLPVQGNLDPQCLLGPEEFVRNRVRSVVQQAKEAPAHIFNVGHGLLPHTPITALEWVIDELRKTQ